MRHSSRLARLILTSAIIASSCACLASRDEVARVASPDGRIEAVTVEVNGGATTSFGYEVFLVRRGGFSRRVYVASLYDAVRRETPDEVAYGVNVRWISASSVVVEYQAAKNAYLVESLVSVAGQPVSVTLQPGVSDPTAPSGGMLYNLGK